MKNYSKQNNLFYLESEYLVAHTKHISLLSKLTLFKHQINNKHCDYMGEKEQFNDFVEDFHKALEQARLTNKRVKIEGYDHYLDLLLMVDLKFQVLK